MFFRDGREDDWFQDWCSISCSSHSVHRKGIRIHHSIHSRLLGKHIQQSIHSHDRILRSHNTEPMHKQGRQPRERERTVQIEQKVSLGRNRKKQVQLTIAFIVGWLVWVWEGDVKSKVWEESLNERFQELGMNQTHRFPFLLYSFLAGDWRSLWCERNKQIRKRRKLSLE